jgi:hypothetical protein
MGQKLKSFFQFLPEGLYGLPSRPFFIPLPPQASKRSGNRFWAIRNT